MRLLGLTLALLAVSPAFAQVGPSFDCAKASNAIERTICKDPELAKVDRAMAVAYAALVGRLAGAAKDELVKDQNRWVGVRDRACTGDDATIARCLKQRYADRTDTLQALAEGAAYPFVSEQLLAKRGTFGKITWSYAIAYPRFDGKTADFSAVNAAFANAAKNAAADAQPTADSASGYDEEWTCEQSFRLYRPGTNTVTVAVQFWSYSGGAHGNAATNCTLVDLSTGKTVGLDVMFKPGPQWLKAMTEIVGADLKKQFVEKPGFEDALEPAKLAKILSESYRYCWRSGRLELIFNSYDVAPYSSGAYEVHIPYEKLAPLMR